MTKNSYIHAHHFAPSAIFKFRGSIQDILEGSTLPSHQYERFDKPINQRLKERFTTFRNMESYIPFIEFTPDIRIIRVPPILRQVRNDVACILEPIVRSTIGDSLPVYKMDFTLQILQDKYQMHHVKRVVDHLLEYCYWL